jgi:hypothetical protein
MNDKMFYEDIIKVYSKGLRKAFAEPEKYRVDEEISRLFRTNAFNKSVRDHELEKKHEKYPVLKESIATKKPDELREWMAAKVSLPR